MAKAQHPSGSFIPVVLSGGSGTRLWPVSRQAFPKQFCDLFPTSVGASTGGELSRSLYARTIERLAPLGSPWTITTGDLKVLTEKTLHLLGRRREEIAAQVLFEPAGRNTAPAIALLCRVLELRGLVSSVVGIFPADHLIHDETGFRAAVGEAIEWAGKGEIVTLGVKPTFPATGYGYIETSGKAGGAGSALRAVRFREKPKAETAREFLSTGRFLWNAGMFVFKADTMISQLRQHAPGVWTPLMEMQADLSNLRSVYEKVQAISLDYAVMEKLTSHVTIPCAFDWSDVGSWDAIAETSGLRRNASLSAAADGIHEIEAKGTFVFGRNEAAGGGTAKTVAVIGVDDLIVVDTADALLIAKRGSSEKVKDVVERLTNGAVDRKKSHVFDVRPWGRFEILRDTAAFKSKVLTIDPGAQISYQSHAKRAEHWIIVAGKGEVVLNDEVIPVRAGSHVFIPVGAKHRIRNTSSEPIEFVEVQLGSYFGEDDIVRYEDAYGRG